VHDTAGEPRVSVDKRTSAHPFKQGAKRARASDRTPPPSSSWTRWPTPSCGRCFVG